MKHPLVKKNYAPRGTREGPAYSNFSHFFIWDFDFFTIRPTPGDSEIYFPRGTLEGPARDP